MGRSGNGPPFFVAGYVVGFNRPVSGQTTVQSERGLLDLPLPRRDRCEIRLRYRNVACASALMCSCESRNPGSRALRLAPWAPAFAGARHLTKPHLILQRSLAGRGKKKVDRHSPLPGPSATTLCCFPAPSGRTTTM